MTPLDGSALAERAVPLAAQLARAHDGRLVLVHVVSPRSDRGQPEVEGDIVAMLEQAAAGQRASGLDARIAVYNGYFAAPGIILARAAAEQGADLIVMSTHGRGGVARLALGSVADDILRHTRLPVLLVPSLAAPDLPTDRPARVTIGLDGSELAERGIEAAQQLFGPGRAELTLLRIVEPMPPGLAAAEITGYIYDPEAERQAAEQYLQDLASRLGGHFKLETAYGVAAQQLAAQATPDTTDLLVIATHGHSGLTRLLLGSVAAGTLARAKVPVLLIRPT
jgi:nucleotide-binding universal stress UspA family protein